MKRPLTLLLGASTNTARTSYRALNLLHAHGYPVYAVGRTEGQIGPIAIHTDLSQLNEPVDTLTMYLNAANQRPWYDDILRLNPRRIVFNPGSENPELESLAQAAGIFTERACTLVLLSTNRY
jgi:predicted CoA-binding protein